MKYRTKLGLIGVVILIHSVSAFSRDVFRVSWRGTAYTTNQSGRVIARPYSQKDIIETYALDAGVDPRSIVVAYVRDEEESVEELAIVSAADGSSIANVFQFLDGLAVTGNNGTDTRRRRFIFDEAHGDALGDIAGAERLRRNAEGRIVSFSYHGRFEFSLPEKNTVFIGSFSTGKRLD